MNFNFFTFENERLHPQKLITILQGNWHQPIWRFTPKYVRNMCKVREICDYGIHGTSSKGGLKTNFILKKIGYITLNKV